MTYLVGHGPPTIGATHTWAPATGSAPPVINNPITSPPTMPWLKLLGMPKGWRTTGELEDNRDPATDYDAVVREVIYPVGELGKTLVYPLQAVAETEEDLMLITNGCMIGFATNREDEGTMTITPFVSIGGPVWTFAARCLEVDVTEDFVWNRHRIGAFRQNVSVTLRMSRPEFQTGGVWYP